MIGSKSEIDGVCSNAFRDLRHTAASLLLSQNVNARVSWKLLGHSSIDPTLNSYSHVIPALQREAADQMESCSVQSLKELRKSRIYFPMLIKPCLPPLPLNSRPTK